MTFENVQSWSFVDIGVPKLELGNEKVGAKQVSSASPAFDLRGNKGKAGETFALPLH